MANIPGASNPLPGVYTDVITASRGVSVPGGTRIAAIIGEGSTDETIVVQANGGGADGLNSTYTSATGADGRHFKASNFPLISNRTTVYKNGIPLVGLEQVISGTFSNLYDYRIDIATGKIELQTAQLVDQGGAYYVPLTTNVGDGYISTLTLVDVNAPPETWTVRCVSVQRTSLNAPIIGTAKFIALGSVSGTQLDSNGNPIVWQANNTVVSNGIISFSIGETTSLRDGDGFTIKVASGVLVRGDSLTMNCIPTLNLNAPAFLQGMNDVAIKHGFPSTTNNLSLGAQLAFANAAPALLTVQAAPPMPRRTSYILSSAVNSESTNNDDFIFPLPIGVTPDTDAEIHFFTTNNSTEVETQILPNKLDFYTLDTSGEPTTTAFITSSLAAPAGYSYFYSVNSALETMVTGEDGYIGRNLAYTNRGVFSYGTALDSTHVGKTLKIISATNVANVGSYTINSVLNGLASVTRTTSFPDFTTATGVTFSVIDPATGLAVVSGSASDGALTNLAATETANLVSASIDFTALGSILTKRLQITGSVLNNGLYDIVLNAAPGTIKIQKAVVNESDMRFEVLNPDEVSNYVVINKDVVTNGYALRISLVDTKEASFYDAGWLSALESLEAFECDIVVPLPKQTISVIVQNTLAHCKTMSNILNKKERVMLTGAIAGLTPDNLTGTTDAAVEDIGILEGIQGDSVTEVLAGNIEDLADYSVEAAFGNTYRCVYFYPDEITVQASAENVVVSGLYVAAAAAGYLSADLRIENPLTNKSLVGFTIANTKQLRPSVQRDLAAAGVCIVQPITGGGKVVWGITTSASGYVEEQEISVVFIRDRVAKTLRTGFADFIGKPEDLNTAALLNGRAVDLLNSLMSNGLLTQYKDLVVQRDDVDPTQWNISVRVQPVYPINFIYIKVSLGQL